MNKSTIQLSVIALILVMVQVLVLNRICLFGVAVPLAFIYVILRLPLTLSKEWVFTISFLIGLVIDIFSDTGGVNALSCVIMSALRHPVLHLYFPREDEHTELIPSIASLGLMIYFKYALTLTTIYCIFAFSLETLSLFNPWHLIECIVASSVLTTALLIGIDSLTLPRREKRL